MRVGKEGKKGSNVVQPPARKPGKKTAQATPGSDRGEERDFCKLLREVQEDRKPIEALLNSPIFRIRFRAIMATDNQELEDAEELAHDFLFKLSRYIPQIEKQLRVRCTLLHDLETEFEGLLASMQTTQSRRAVQKAFDASPAQLGRAAVKSANKKR